MNERIREFESQCWELKKYGPPWFNSEKFAELIVQECIQAVYDDGQDAEYYQDRIKKRFGVE
jgi:hypothetical protein